MQINAFRTNPQSGWDARNPEGSLESKGVFFPRNMDGRLIGLYLLALLLKSFLLYGRSQ